MHQLVKPVGCERNTKRLIKLLVLVMPLLSFLCGCEDRPSNARKKIAELGLEYSTETFLKCIREGNKVATELFLVSGKDPNIGVGKILPTIEAAQSASMLRLLVSFGADPSKAGGQSGDTAVHKTIRVGNLDGFTYLLSTGIDVDLVAPLDGWTLLGVACLGNTANAGTMAKLLVDAGADVNIAQKGSGLTPLMFASSNLPVETVMILIDAGADVNAKSRAYGNTPIREALSRKDGGDEIVSLLVDAGAKLGAVGEMVHVSDYGFYIDKYEVTNAQYAAFLNEKGNRSEGGASWLEDDSKHVLIEKEGGQFTPKSGYGDHPVIVVSWYGAKSYCEWAGKRLPTEEEWQQACQGMDGREYSWGNSFGSDISNISGSDDGYDKTSPVGTFPGGASPYGAMDMSGNVWEWTSSLYESSKNWRVLRGGSWNDFADFARCESRNGDDPASRFYDYGFRCAR